MEEKPVIYEPPKKSKLPIILLAIVLLAGACVGGIYIGKSMNKKEEPKVEEKKEDKKEETKEIEPVEETKEIEPEKEETNKEDNNQVVQNKSIYPITQFNENGSITNPTGYTGEVTGSYFSTNIGHSGECLQKGEIANNCTEQFNLDVPYVKLTIKLHRNNDNWELYFDDKKVLTTSEPISVFPTMINNNPYIFVITGSPNDKNTIQVMDLEGNIYEKAENKQMVFVVANSNTDYSIVVSNSSEEYFKLENNQLTKLNSFNPNGDNIVFNAY